MSRGRVQKCSVGSMVLGVRWYDFNVHRSLGLVFLPEPAAYHFDFRAKIILMDAQQPGAPSMSSQPICLRFGLTRTVWREGMSVDYTSYSPVTLGWNDDPSSIRDRKGRQVCLMHDPPEDWKHNPGGGYMKCEGLVMLDINNRPIVEYPGAPLTLASTTKGWILEGLVKTFGMTIYE